MKKQKRIGKLESASHTLKAMLGNSTRFSDSYKVWKLSSVWDDIAGEFSDFSKPTSFIRGVLYVSVKSAGHLQQLDFLKEEIINKIEHYEKNWVKSIHLKLR